MNSAKLKSYLEVSTNVAVLLVAACILFILASNYLSQRRAPQVSQGLAVGQTLPDVPGIKYQDAHQTLILALSVNCHFCSESLPFYKNLANSHQGNSDTKLVAIFPESNDAVKSFAQENNLNFQTVSLADFNNLKIGGTPTLILVDQTGKVLNFWVGKVSSDSERQAISSLL